MRTLEKNWDKHVIQAEEVARSVAFQELRDLVLERVEPAPEERAIDLGAGTGLLTLALAGRVSSVWALDISAAMCHYLEAKARSAGIDNIDAAVGSVASLPFVDECVDLVVSNYCFHHLGDEDKLRALAEVRRVLRPGGRLVFADMMFRPVLSTARDRTVVSSKAKAMLRKGPAGYARLAKNVARLITASWEKPVRPEWWADALHRSGFEDISVEPLRHEGGIAVAKKPQFARKPQ